MNNVPMFYIVTWRTQFMFSILSDTGHWISCVCLRTLSILACTCFLKRVLSLFVILWILVDTPNECSVACKQICKIALTWILRRSSQSLRVELLHEYIVVTFTILPRLSYRQWRRVYCLKHLWKCVLLNLLPYWKIKHFVINSLQHFYHVLQLFIDKSRKI